MKKYLCVLIIISTSLMVSGNSFCDSLFFSKCRSPKESSLFLFTAGYRMPVNNNIIINSGRGLFFEGGINPGRLISKKLVIGFYAGWAFMDRLWNTSFNKDFSGDLRSSINEEGNFSELDKAVINSGTALFNTAAGNSSIIPGCEMSSFHNYSLYYGIVIKMPYKYIPAIKIYKGTTRSHYQGDGNIATKGKEFNIFELQRPMYGCELIIFNGPGSFSKNKKLKKAGNSHIGALSLYYEACNFNNSSLYFYDGENKINLSVRQFTSSSFMKKYKTEMSMGFKLSFIIM